MKKQRRSLDIYFDSTQYDCIAAGVPNYSFLNQQAARLTVLGPAQSACFNHRFQCHQDPNSFQGCSNLELKAAKTNRLFVQSNFELAKSTKELTLSGFVPYHAIYFHPFIWSSGFQEFKPEQFRVELPGKSWDVRVLQGFSVTNLKVLKLPLSWPSDCVHLGRALATMPKLESLAITDIPDREELVAELEWIGKGIMACASTLRELNLEMTTSKRSPEWSREACFFEPEEIGFFFRKFFPYAPTEENGALCERYDRGDPDPVVEAPLCLTRLRLSHLRLPWYSFGTVLNATTIKHIELPYSNVDGRAWRFLKPHTQLESLTEISFEMMSAELLHFLSKQSSLKELTFAGPPHYFHPSRVKYFGNWPYNTVFFPSEDPNVDDKPGFLSLDDFMSSLKDLTTLKHLALPIDMYKMTSRSLIFIAETFTALEHLELGFNYEDIVRAAALPLIMKSDQC